MVSVILPVKNVEGIIHDCLNGVRWADEVLLVDGNSTDKTREIAASYHNVRIIIHSSNDIRVKTTESEQHARNPWIFWVHADEVVTPELGKEILERCATAPSEVGGFVVPTRDVLFGVEWGTGDPWPRIWRKGHGKFEFKRMHEMPVIKGDTPMLKNFYWHINNPNIRTVIPKYLQYEYVDVQKASDEACARVNTGFWYQLLRFNYFAIRGYLPFRRHGFPATASAFCYAFGNLIRHLLHVEELRIRKGLTKRDTHGWS